MRKRSHADRCTGGTRTVIRSSPRRSSSENVARGQPVVRRLARTVESPNCWPSIDTSRSPCSIRPFAGGPTTRSTAPSLVTLAPSRGYGVGARKRASALPAATTSPPPPPHPPPTTPPLPPPPPHPPPPS